MRSQRILKQSDAATMNRLAEHLLRLDDAEINVGEELLDMISTSKILAADTERKDYVGLYTTVTYTPTHIDEQRTLTLVCPHEGNPQLAHVSVLSPIGMALIGRKVSNTVTVTLPSNRTEKIKILEVVNSNLISEVEQA